MWNKARFNNGDEVLWRVDKDAFEVKCVLGENSVMPGCRLNVCSRTMGRNHKMCIGSFVSGDSNCTIHKTYSTAYLRLQNIEPDCKPEFEVTSSDGNVIFYTDNSCLDTCESLADESEDFSLIRARNILETAGNASHASDDAERAARNTLLIMSGYQQISLPCFQKYKWHRIDNLKEDFYLSSVNHLIFENDFFAAFSQAGEWFFGSCDKRLFASCIAYGHEASPFANALDCTVCEKDLSSGVYYHAVGIALLDDGQYFYRV